MNLDTLKTPSNLISFGAGVDGVEPPTLPIKNRDALNQLSQKTKEATSRMK
jgi:hypothetical protein